MTEITFEVEGIPMPQGSHTAISRGGKPALIPAGTNTSRKAFAAWRAAVADAALAAAGDELLDGPMEVHITFRFPMPKSRSAATRDTGWAWKTTKPDADKLARACCDSLSQTVITDDARIARLLIEKVELGPGTWYGAEIRIRPCTGDWL